MQTASNAAFEEAANKIGCDTDYLRAVFEVEAAGRFFNRDGSLVRRFEPHHFPRHSWGMIGFKVGNTAPWRASLRLRTSVRRAMFEKANRLDPEAAARASSYGAPQIMGFNHAAAGYISALDMVANFAASADEQVRAFVRFVVSKGLDTHIRSKDALSFATGYNGSGKARDYASKIESAYRRISGRSSPQVLRVGAQGDSVFAAQKRLVELGHLDHADGAFGPKTKRAVLEFQDREGLTRDGVIGAKTWSALEEETPAVTVKPEAQETAEVINTKEVAKYLLPSAGGVGVGRFFDDLGVWAEVILIGGAVLGGLTVLAVWALPRVKGALRQ